MTRMRKTPVLAPVMIGALAMAGCVPSTRPVLETGRSAVALRSFQQRAFDTTDKEKTLRTVISTLQDLGFVVDKADLELGTVSATKLAGYQLRITVSVRPRGSTQMLVRANAQYRDRAIEDPQPYQDFFVALEKSMFLTAQQVD
jgi:hypothetical protein